MGVGAAQVDDLDRAGLAATVSAATATDPGGVCPGQSPQRGAQQRLVALHGEQVVPATLSEEVRVRPLAVQRIRGDQHTAQVGQGVQGDAERGELIAGGHRRLGEHQLVGVVIDADQLGLLTISIPGTRSVLPSTASTLRVSAAVVPAARCCRQRAWRPITHLVSAASTAVISTAASTRRNVEADGGAPHTPTACGAVAAHCAIATHEPAPAITACTASSSTDCRP